MLAGIFENQSNTVTHPILQYRGEHIEDYDCFVALTVSDEKHRYFTICGKEKVAKM